MRLDANGRAELRIPLAPNRTNIRDYSARIEAQVTDASSRAGLRPHHRPRHVRHVPAVGADSIASVFRPGSRVAADRARAWTTSARRSASVPVTLDARTASSTARATTTRRPITACSWPRRRRTDAEGRAETAPDAAAGVARQLPRHRRRRRRDGRDDRGSRLALGAGARDDRRRTKAIATSS